MSGTAITAKDLIPINIWVITLGKVMVQQNVLKKADIICELNNTMKIVTDTSTKDQIKEMIQTVTKW